MTRPRFMDADVISVYLFLWMLSRRAAWATAAAVGRRVPTQGTGGPVPRPPPGVGWGRRPARESGSLAMIPVLARGATLPMRCYPNVTFSIPERYSSEIPIHVIGRSWKAHSIRKATSVSRPDPRGPARAATSMEGETCNEPEHFEHDGDPHS